MFSSVFITDFEQVNASWVLRVSFRNKPWYGFFVDTKHFIFQSQRQIYNPVTSQIEGFVKNVNGLSPLKVFTRSTILDVWRGSEYASGSVRFCFLERIYYTWLKYFL